MFVTEEEVQAARDSLNAYVRECWLAHCTPNVNRVINLLSRRDVLAASTWMHPTWRKHHGFATGARHIDKDMTEDWQARLKANLAEQVVELFAMVVRESGIRLVAPLTAYVKLEASTLTSRVECDAACIPYPEGGRGFYLPEAP